MVTPRQVVLAAELLIGLVVLAGWWTSFRQAGSHSGAVSPTGILVGVVAGALDTIGIDGVATAAVILRTFGLVDADRIPGTLQAGFALPAVVQAVMLTTTLETHFNSLVLLAVAAALGAWPGSQVVTRLSPAARRTGLGIALLAVGLLMLAVAVNGWANGVELALHGPPLFIALAGFFVVGALAPLGAGTYGPGMLILTGQGMTMPAAQPIARAAWVVVSATAGRQFVRRGQCDFGVALSLAAGAIAAVGVTARFVDLAPRYGRVAMAAIILFTGARTVWAARRPPTLVGT